jgi:hypothetical protein
VFSVARTTGELLAEAVRLARENAEAGQGPFGALVARDGEVVGIGVTTIRLRPGAHGGRGQAPRRRSCRRDALSAEPCRY